MKRAIYPIIGAAVALVALIIFSTTVNGSLIGFGQDRSALARTTVQTYWSEIAAGKIPQAYHMMSSGNQESRSLSAYAQDMYGFLTQVGDVHAAVGTPQIDNNLATVPVTLTSPKSSQKLHAYQHLYWENGHWRISDMNGGLSSKK